MTPYYQDESVTIYHGDCREIAEWLSADVLVTDPPYGVDYKPDGLHSTRSIRIGSQPSITGDDSTTLRDVVLDLWGSRPAVVFGSWRRPLRRQPSHRLIWHKTGRHPGVSPHPWYPVDEEVWLLGDGWTGKPTPTVITTHEQRAMEPGKIGHPTPKPLALMGLLVSKCPPGVIADPFAGSGSGSTLLAAKSYGRRSVGVEIEERYCEIAANRCSQEVLGLSA